MTLRYHIFDVTYFFYEYIFYIFVCLIIIRYLILNVQWKLIKSLQAYLSMINLYKSLLFPKLQYVNSNWNVRVYISKCTSRFAIQNFLSWIFRFSVNWIWLPLCWKYWKRILSKRAEKMKTCTSRIFASQKGNISIVGKRILKDSLKALINRCEKFSLILQFFSFCYVR